MDSFGICLYFFREFGLLALRLDANCFSSKQKELDFFTGMKIQRHMWRLTYKRQIWNELGQFKSDVDLRNCQTLFLQIYQWMS
jgi:hypothetical protein